MSIQVSRYFHGRWSVFFATTYTFDPRAFDDFWFRRLGDPPVNANILVDHTRLERLYTRSESWAWRRVNSDYLVRGIRLTNGAFHPKTYFFANRTEGILLVGSGNLGVGGLEEGHEVFTVFHSAQQDQLGTLQAWRDWVSRLVSSLDDDRLTVRWIAAQREAPWLQGRPADSIFVSNLEKSIFAQITSGLSAPVDELHLLAPFYDAHAAALQALVHRLAPREIHLYLGANTSVDGTSLAGVLTASQANLRLFTYRPAEFVHAKLVGVIVGNQGRLLSGSANISQAALLGSVAAGSANVEAGILLETNADHVRRAFVPNNLELVPANIEQVSSLRYLGSSDTADQSYPLVLRSAALLPDGRTRVVYAGPSEGISVLLANDQDTQAVIDQETVGPLAGVESARLVWLTSPVGEQLSNRVAVDIPRQLDGWLRTRVETTSTPEGLQAGDLTTPVGQILLRLNASCVFDIDETPAAKNAQRLASEDETVDPAFWEKLLQEDLRADPRISSYQRWAASGRYFSDNDDILAVLHTMLNRVPEQWQARIVGGPDGQDTGEQEPARHWPTERRLRIRLANVLERWCRATGDPRLRWIDQLAPVRNYVALLTALTECWAGQHLPEERLVTLAYTLFSNFIGSKMGSGYFSAVDTETRQSAARLLRGEPAQVGAALVYCAFPPTVRWSEHVFAWQPSLFVGLEAGLLNSGSDAVRVVGAITGKSPTEQEIEERLYSTARVKATGL